jgi:hypothetical protein
MVPQPNLKVSDRTGLKSPPEDRTLRFRKDGTFHIAVFEDLHFAERTSRSLRQRDGTGIENVHSNLFPDNDKDAKSKKVMSYILAEEDIDFVVLNGDLVSGERTLKSNSSKYVLSVISPLVNEGYLWASTYGNHDSEINLDPEEDVFKTETRYRSSLTQSRVSGPKAGITNYYLPVFSHSASNTKPALILWFFDSKGGHYHQKNGEGGLSAKRPNWIDGSVVDWFTSSNSKLKAEFGVIPSLAFYHIPTHTMLHYQQEGSVHPQLNPGHNCERVKAQGTIDWSYGSQDVKFMKALLETEGLVAGFSGHDHQNDWYGFNSPESTFEAFGYILTIEGASNGTNRSRNTD